MRDAYVWCRTVSSPTAVRWLHRAVVLAELATQLRDEVGQTSGQGAEIAVAENGGRVGGDPRNGERHCSLFVNMLEERCASHCHEDLEGILVASSAGGSAAQTLVCTRRPGTLVAAKRFTGSVRCDG